jgi:hypothetical protein
MPSRKKAQGQARKAKKEKQAREQAIAQQRASCKHFTMPENATQEDIDAAERLLAEYIDKLMAIAIHVNVVDDSRAITKLVKDTYHKYFQFNDVRKQVFREAILAYGTESCVIEANEQDLTEEQNMTRTWHFVLLLAYVEGRDKKYQSTFDASEIGLAKQINATARCPRETVRLFHRRNSCDEHLVGQIANRRWMSRKLSTANAKWPNTAQSNVFWRTTRITRMSANS